MRQSAKVTKTRIEPLLIPGNLAESLHLARSAAAHVTTMWMLQTSDKDHQEYHPRP
ncbi:hypothetical protein HNR77_003043 [Paenibacillus sp. JGP012]|jgi:hypothetical protein|uniref:hypothetical protein n=1 Tax=Paenibacillus TaxID=44249 RepID=UPI00160DCF40|nr:MULTISPECIES: hypothetical protein [Paenibacillus]MBB6021948.1 hypothetical protein [Paenibacillus sp. JGP012]MBU5355481.1 hypothetical protein [Paenibacillus barcinonensis]MDM5276040.1 hypothetical protein [Paenibacillus silvae]